MFQRESALLGVHPRHQLIVSRVNRAPSGPSVRAARADGQSITPGLKCAVIRYRRRSGHFTATPPRRRVPARPVARLREVTDSGCSKSAGSGCDDAFFVAQCLAARFRASGRAPSPRPAALSFSTADQTIATGCVVDGRRRQSFSGDLNWKAASTRRVGLRTIPCDGPPNCLLFPYLRRGTRLACMLSRPG